MQHSDVMDALRPSVVRLIILQQQFSKALVKFDHDRATEVCQEIITTIYALEDAWSALEAGTLDAHVSTAVDAAMKQLRERAKHN